MLKSACLAIALCIASQALWANEFWENWDISVAAGYGERTNPLLNADDLKTYINVDIAWYGDRFFFDNGDVGYNLYYGENLSLNFVGQLNNERDFFGETNIGIVSFEDVFLGGAPADIPSEVDGEQLSVQEPVEYEVTSRDHAYEAGIEAIYENEWGQIQLSILNDITGKHEGQRADLVYSNTYIHQRWLISPSVGLSWKSDALTDYYFGVESDETNDFILEYTADSTLNSFARLLFNYAIKKDLFWGLAMEYEKLGSEISDSPIVVEDDVFTAYTGIKYRF